MVNTSETKNEKLKNNEAIVQVMKQPKTFAQQVEIIKEKVRWIQRFEYTHELAWKVMKDYAEYQGYTDIRSSRDAIRKALEMGLIDDKQWTETIEARNLTSHNHDNDVVSEEKMQSLNTPSLFD